MNYDLENRSFFRTTTVNKLIKFISRGFGSTIKSKLKIEFSEKYDFIDPKGREQINPAKWGGEAWGDDEIFIWIDRNLKFPLMIESEYSPKAKYIDGQFIKNRHEMFIFLFAHEFFHIVQSQFKDPLILSYLLPIDEEAQCDIAAMIILNKWRRQRRAYRKHLREKP